MNDDELNQDTPDQAPEGQDDIGAAASRLAGLMDDSDNLPMPEDTSSDPEPDKPAAAKAAETPADEDVEVDIDGHKITLPKSKADKLNAERLMQTDYTKKTMALAEERKAADSIKQQATQQEAAYAQRLVQLAQQIEGAVQTGHLKPPDPALLDSDPVEYLKQQNRWNQAQGAYQQMRAEHEQLQGKAAAAQQQQLLQSLETQREQLLAKLPEWKDEGKAEKERAALKTHLLQLGYSPEEVGGVSDHRSVILARESMLYRQMVAEQKATLAKKVPAAQPRPVKAGAASDAAPSPLNQAAMTRLRTGGKTIDAARAIASLLN